MKESSLKLQLKLFLKGLISKLFTAYLGDRFEAVLMKSDTGYFLIPGSDLSFTRSISVHRPYNKKLVGDLEKVIQKNDRVLIVGSHVGSLVVSLSRACSQLVAVEANPKTYQLLEKKLMLNQIDNVTVHNIAAFDSKTTVPFLVPKENSGGGKILPQNAPGVTFAGGYEKVHVEADLLDNYLKGQKFDVIITDIEGAEVKAFKGMQRLFAECRSLVCELCPWTLEELAKSTASGLFSLLPNRFNVAVPLGVKLARPQYDRSAFEELYVEARRSYYFPGVDIWLHSSSAF